MLLFWVDPQAIKKIPSETLISKCSPFPLSSPQNCMQTRNSDLNLKKLF